MYLKERSNTTSTALITSNKLSNGLQNSRRLLILCSSCRLHSASIQPSCGPALRIPIMLRVSKHKSITYDPEFLPRRNDMYPRIGPRPSEGAANPRLIESRGLFRLKIVSKLDTSTGPHVLSLNRGWTFFSQSIFSKNGWCWISSAPPTPRRRADSAVVWE